MLYLRVALCKTPLAKSNILFQSVSQNILLRNQKFLSPFGKLILCRDPAPQNRMFVESFLYPILCENPQAETYYSYKFFISKQ